MKRLVLPFFSGVVALAWGTGAFAVSAERVAVRRLEDRVRVEVGGRTFTEYVFRGVPKPYLYPLVAADGTELTRAFPLRTDVAGEETDHLHQRSLWFAHGKVNGVDFWNENGANKGKIVCDSVAQSAAEGTATILARNRWVAPDGAIYLTDDTRIRIQPVPDGGRWLDYEVTLQAPAERPVVLGDTKEGSMAIRLPRWMTLPRTGQKTTGGEGTIVNDRGARDGATWGKRAAWVDYHAPKGGQIYGVALFDHPQNPRHPTWWQVRDYGLFAANPFGHHDFEGTREKPLPANLGDLTIPAGGRVTFRWRFYFHLGDEKTANVAEHYRDYAGEKVR